METKSLSLRAGRVGANGGNEGGNLVCLDFKTGDVLRDGRTNSPRALPKGSLTFADGRLYYRDENGPMSARTESHPPAGLASSNRGQWKTVLARPGLAVLLRRQNA